MHPQCEKCSANFSREPGFYLGSIYFNYGLTALISTVAYTVMMFQRWPAPWLQVTLTLSFAVLFPLWFFRYARALWLGFDQYVDPRAGEQK